MAPGGQNGPLARRSEVLRKLSGNRSVWVDQPTWLGLMIKRLPISSQRRIGFAVNERRPSAAIITSAQHFDR